MEYGRFGHVPRGHLGRIGLDLMTAILAPDNEANAGTSRAAERRRRPRFGLHPYRRFDWRRLATA
jgi:hypothetical protein